MRRVDELKGKSVLVLGLAKSGFAAAKILHELGARILVNDNKAYNQNPEAKALEQLGIEVVCGEHPLHLLDGMDLMVKNPGIPYGNILVQEALSRQLPVWTEIELAYRLSEADIVAVTGSNGKTTTTTLIKEMLENSGRTPLIAGNIGTVASEVAKSATTNDIMVLELSSFQLMGTEAFKPNIAVWLNIFDAHLDYHGSREEYIGAKAKIGAHLNESDALVYNADDEIVVAAASQLNGNKIPFSVKQKVKKGAYVEAGMICFQEETIIDLSEVVLPGAHNVENMLAAVAAAKLAGAKSEQIRLVLKGFKGVKHRLQFVRDWDGIQIYNDSKATNILATKAALSAFSKPIILIAGGLDRGNEFDELSQSLTHVKVLVTYGETKEKLSNLAKKIGLKTIQAERVEDATKVALSESQPGDVVLLSPACASWDQYKSFEERGEAFLTSVSEFLQID
ncbi:UDP-N-acetylmuramoyl-L-alanine--D-glutamate ligase [Shouchella patagoniensis]|uniref:UDP-N-acetylmuramoyl-L-alanine--D-glutamate ligase n=1 Tax=Shouchella patagoniensis TaxID=228576 RepID=UPI000995232B|nr:UDP-N-acetylmuramoyl-L-alanine--D-glutamate ligase [Shouchella patagoniensis]